MSIRGIRRPGGAALMTACVWMAAARAQTKPSASAHWQGEIQIPDRTLSITVDLTTNTAGKWIGSMTVRGTTSVDVPLDAITVAGAAVGFTANLPGKTTFQGTLSDDAKALTGSVANDQGAVPFQLTRNGDAAVKIPAPSSALLKRFEGTWNGTIEIPGRTPTHVQLQVAGAADGVAVATMIAVDQGNEQIPMTTVVMNGNDLQMETRIISGTYHGTLGANGEIAGEWSQGGARLPLTFRR